MAEADKMRQLLELIRLHPSVRACIQRILNEVVPESLLISEGGKPIKPALQRLIGPLLSTFLENSIEMAFMCGFVVFTRTKYEGIPVPLLLSLGSFSWGVEAVTSRTKKRKREAPCHYRYSVRPHHPEVNVDDLYVFEFLPPAIRNEFCLPSPLDALCSLSNIMRLTQKKLEKVLEWNCQKHIVTSEKVNIPKDTTTEGVCLLDDFRRYLVTGDHLGINKNHMTMNGLRTHLSQNPSKLSSSLIQAQFKEEASERVYTLPPNTEIHELSGLKLEANMTELHDLMQRQVTDFFQMPLLTDIGGKDISSFVQQKELKQMRYMANFGGRLMQYTYAAIFDVQQSTVEVHMEQPSGMHINSAEDVKKLHESNTLLPSDKLKIRKHLMKNL
jgi:hypothetical protein